MRKKKELQLVKTAPESHDEDEALDTVVSKIRPLPSDLAPSQEFMQQTRLRLLKLPSYGSSTDQQAA